MLPPARGKRADADEVHIRGTCVAGSGARVQPERGGVGMVFQEFALFPA